MYDIVIALGKAHHILAVKAIYTERVRTYVQYCLSCVE